ncbi:M1 family metallopeptidase, partial [Limnofasciculus baicalensis]
DEPFPWDKYAQACIRGFNGGMENTSATFLTSRAGTRKRGDQDDLLSHELAHQWTGDLITCNSWEHIWLNEGWASSAEALWDEELALQENADKPNAKALAREAYEKAIIGQVRRQRRGNRASAPTSPAMVSNRYSNPDAVFSKADDAYAKGAVILHMLREQLGHDVFDRGVRLYFDRFKFKIAETADFRRIMEEVSGVSLEKFFTQWCYRPGIPRLSIDQTYDAAAKTLTVTLSQIQKIDGHNPAYDLVVPIRVITDRGETWVTIHSDRSEQAVTIPLASAPTDVQVDPNLTVLASVTVHKPTAMWMNQLLRPSTAFARVQAMEHVQDVATARLTTLAVGMLDQHTT